MCHRFRGHISFYTLNGRYATIDYNVWSIDFDTFKAFYKSKLMGKCVVVSVQWPSSPTTRFAQPIYAKWHSPCEKKNRAKNGVRIIYLAATSGIKCVAYSVLHRFNWFLVWTQKCAAKRTVCVFDFHFCWVEQQTLINDETIVSAFWNFVYTFSAGQHYSIVFASDCVIIFVSVHILFPHCFGNPRVSVFVYFGQTHFLYTVFGFILYSYSECVWFFRLNWVEEVAHWNII